LFEKNLYATENLYEAAFCLCKGMKLIGKEKTGSKVTVFFEGKDAHIEALKFYNGGKVEAKAYSDSYRTLKDYVFQR
jgi:hypothetical protein